MSVYCIVNQTGRLSDPTKKMRLPEPLAYTNQRAHSFRFTVLAEGSDEPADLTGVGVVGQFIKASANETVFPILGTASDGVCEIVLPESCYLSPGRFTFTMDITSAADATGVPTFSTSTAYDAGDRVVYQGVVYEFQTAHAAGAWTGEDAVCLDECRTVLWIEGIVERNTTGEIIDPGSPIGNVESVISRCATATANANGAATTANNAADAAEAAAEEAIGNFAPAFAQATANAAGSYVTYTDGKVYFLPDGHTANEAWADTEKADVTVGEEITAFKSDLGLHDYGVFGPDYTTNGKEGGNTSRGVIFTKKYNEVNVNGTRSGYVYSSSLTATGGYDSVSSGTRTADLINTNHVLKKGHAYVMEAEVVSGTYEKNGANGEARFVYWHMAIDGTTPTNETMGNIDLTETNRFSAYYEPTVDEYVAFGIVTYVKNKFTNMVVRFTYKDVSFVRDVINALRPTASLSMSPLTMTPDTEPDETDGEGESDER